MQKDITRRNFFSQLCSKETVNTVVGAWYGFSKEVKKEIPISCDEAGLMLGRKAQIRNNNSLSKGGIK